MSIVQNELIGILCETGHPLSGGLVKALLIETDIQTVRQKYGSSF
jgi:hypothetical protein